MKMTPLNIGIFAIAIIAGLIVGFAFPLLGLILFVPVVIFVIVVFMRNKSGAMATAEETANALAMNVSPGKARIYVMRKGFVGGQQGMNITIDGDLESQIRSKYFLMAEIEPGKHSVKAKMSSGSESAARTHELEITEGGSVLLDMKLQMGALQGTPDFTEIRDIAKAKSMLEGCKLVHWKQPNSREPAKLA